MQSRSLSTTRYAFVRCARQQHHIYIYRKRISNTEVQYQRQRCHGFCCIYTIVATQTTTTPTTACLNAPKLYRNKLSMFHLGIETLLPSAQCSCAHCMFCLCSVHGMHDTHHDVSISERYQFPECTPNGNAVFAAKHRWRNRDGTCPNRSDGTTKALRRRRAAKRVSMPHHEELTVGTKCAK